jgi:hypothetical protein
LKEGVHFVAGRLESGSHLVTSPSLGIASCVMLGIIFASHVKISIVSLGEGVFRGRNCTAFHQLT